LGATNRLGCDGGETTIAKRVELSVQPPERLSKLLNFRLGEIFFVLGFSELLRNVIEIPEHAFQNFPHLVQLRPG